jgi:hypothetical protein
LATMSKYVGNMGGHLLLDPKGCSERGITCALCRAFDLPQLDIIVLISSCFLRL